MVKYVIYISGISIFCGTVVGGKRHERGKREKKRGKNEEGDGEEEGDIGEGEANKNRH